MKTKIDNPHICGICGEPAEWIDDNDNKTCISCRSKQVKAGWRSEVYCPIKRIENGYYDWRTYLPEWTDRPDITATKELKTKYKYIHFIQAESKTKTSVWTCFNSKHLNTLGYIKWHGPWRQYCWFPFENTIFNKGCNEDINDFITQLMDERKQ